MENSSKMEFPRNPSKTYNEMDRIWKLLEITRGITTLLYLHVDVSLVRQFFFHLIVSDCDEVLRIRLC